MLRQMEKMSLKHRLLAVAVGLLVAGIAVGLAAGPALHGVGVALRWVGVGLLGVFAVWRRSVTVWIVVAMGAGVELGVDAPTVGGGRRVFSGIFFRLI